jgi:hypothetical protein
MIFIEDEWRQIYQRRPPENEQCIQGKSKFKGNIEKGFWQDDDSFYAFEF